ncbi:uncharacterized protein N7473_007818 [Penicillium subrubescens]|nr:uncharacterized protein N7473_007818 [Penicillium subrubescens]KAJ5891590.1 hypothetical protein N7473_007818 [Penicillium subrubescens]
MEREERPAQLEVTSNRALLNEGHSERLYGYPAALCLFRASQKLLGATLNANPSSLRGPLVKIMESPALRTSLRRHYEMFPFRKACTEQPISGDQEPITSPPQFFIYSVLDRYLNHINLYIPVFGAGTLYDTVADCYRPDGPPSQAGWLVCLNCIVLLTLHLDACVARRSGLGMDPWSTQSEVINNALNNCRRALANLDALLQPGVVNIQALIMLALVAREFFISAVFENVCSAACKLARSMGLHRCVGMANDSVLEARQRLFWILYVMDKTRVFLSGHSPDLHLFDSEFQLRLSDSQMSVASDFHCVMAHMMTVWEEIYIGLYSARAVRLGAEYRHSQVDRLDRMCDECQPLIPLQESSDPGLRLMQLEVRYCFHVSKILIHRCHRMTGGWQRCHEHAVSALQIITDVFEQPATPGSCVILGRIFQNYPLVAFHDLCLRYLTEGLVDVAAMLPRLINVRRQLSSLEHKGLPSAYFTKLNLGVTWCTDLMSVVNNSSKALEPTTCLLTPSTSTDMGDLLPSMSLRDENANYWADTSDTLIQDQSDILGTFGSPDYFFDPTFFEALLPEEHFTT